MLNDARKEFTTRKPILPEWVTTGIAFSIWVSICEHEARYAIRPGRRVCAV